jgi:hypothetical protein
VEIELVAGLAAGFVAVELEAPACHDAIRFGNSF